MTIGILALQGDFEAHGAMLTRLNAPWELVTEAYQLEALTGLIIPGGESTTMLKLLDPALRDGIVALHTRGGALYGTCAGTILLARTVLNPPQTSLGLLDIEVERNGYGRQMESSVLPGSDPRVDGELVLEEMVFIRAPVIRSHGPAVRVLTRVDGQPVFVEQEKVMVTTFHPELSTDSAVHRRFLEKNHA